jgi:DNA modification methylase
MTTTDTPRVATHIKNHWTGTHNTVHSWDVYLGDSQHVLTTLPDECFDCVITSPPYYWLRDYGIKGQVGHEDTVTEYIDSLATIMDQVYRVLRKCGVLFVNLGDTYYSGKGKSHGADPKSTKRRFGLRAVDKSGGVGVGIRPKSIIGTPWRTALEMVKRRWILRSSIIWHRKHALTEAVKDRPRRSYEYLFMFVKSRNYFFNRAALSDIVVEEDVWTIPARPKPTNGIDTAPFPDELVERCLNLGCPADGHVLDPFAGAGTTLRVALTAGRSTVGIDLHPDFCRYMVDQLRLMSAPRCISDSK